MGGWGARMTRIARRRKKRVFVKKHMFRSWQRDTGRGFERGWRRGEMRNRGSNTIKQMEEQTGL